MGLMFNAKDVFSTTSDRAGRSWRWDVEAAQGRLRERAAGTTCSREAVPTSPRKGGCGDHGRSISGPGRVHRRCCISPYLCGPRGRPQCAMQQRREWSFAARGVPASAR